MPARTPIDVSSADRHQHVADAVGALEAWNTATAPHPQFYLQGDVLARVVQDEDDVRLQPYSQAALLEWLSRVAAFWKRDGPTHPPTYVAQMILARPPHELPDLPRINRVTDVPVFGVDERVETSPGYHESARAYFAPAAGMDGLPPVAAWENEIGSDYVRPDDVERALSLFKELVCDFPFADQASRAHAFCMMLEPFVRELIGNQPTPLYAVLAHTPGTGKSLLTRVCLGVGCGGVAPESYATDQDELRKRITATLVEGRTSVWLDNLPQGVTVDSPVLASALTSARWRDRILGSTKIVDVPIRNVWVATANNVYLSRELARRCVPIFLDPGDGPDPLTRTDYKHPDLEVWAEENRTELVWAALTLIGNWLHGTHQDVSPEGDVYRPRAETTDFLGSYKRWSDVLGGILVAAGSRAFLGNLGKLHADADQDTSERGIFLRDVYERTKGEPMRRDDLADVIQGKGADAETDLSDRAVPLPLELRGTPDFKQALGYWLRSRKGEIMGGYRIVKVDGRYPRWGVEKVGAAESVEKDGLVSRTS